MNKNQEIIEQAYSSNMENMDKNEVSKAVEETIICLNSGELRVAEFIDNDWKLINGLKKLSLFPLS